MSLEEQVEGLKREKQELQEKVVRLSIQRYKCHVSLPG